MKAKRTMQKQNDPFELLDRLFPPTKPTLPMSDDEWERKVLKKWR